MAIVLTLFILRITAESTTGSTWFKFGVFPVSFLFQQDGKEDDNKGKDDCCGHLNFLRQSGHRLGLELNDVDMSEKVIQTHPIALGDWRQQTAPENYQS